MRRALAASLLVAALTPACNGDSGPRAERAPSPCPGARLADDAGEVPAELRLGRHATITKVRRRGTALGITAVSTKTVVELYPPLARAVLDSGYSIVASDNEGFEAEIYFGNETTTGAYRLREGPCKGQVTVRLLFDETKGPK